MTVTELPKKLARPEAAHEWAGRLLGRNYAAESELTRRYLSLGRVSPLITGEYMSRMLGSLARIKAASVSSKDWEKTAGEEFGELVRLRREKWYRMARMPLEVLKLEKRIEGYAALPRHLALERIAKEERLLERHRKRLGGFKEYLKSFPEGREVEVAAYHRNARGLREDAAKIESYMQAAKVRLLRLRKGLAQKEGMQAWR